jgi:hypothetical protein
MRLRSWRCKPAPLPRRASLPRCTPNERPAWVTAPMEVCPTSNPGRARRLTPGQQWRANGGGW